MAGGLLPPVVATLIADTKDYSAKLTAAKAQMEETSKSGSSAFSSLAGVGKMALVGIGVAAVGTAVISTKLASDFQSSMTALVTGAGEAQSNMKLVSNGILDMAAKVGQTPKALADGMYLIESAGYHGAAGLSVLKAAAEGAAVGNADMKTVAGAVTTALTDYNLPAAKAAAVTSALVETVASGKTNMTDLGTSIGKVMPTAAALGVNFQTVTGAMAVMTNAGLSARLAAMHLNNTLLSLSAPSKQASDAL
ncbi:MAG: phage tail tape measure protein, partial [Cyanobacteria bacterium REEB65]|nr:phage tail tape measure protein [Cyanobacteria bacterium REEB65]